MSITVSTGLNELGKAADPETVSTWAQLLQSAFECEASLHEITTAGRYWVKIAAIPSHLPYGHVNPANASIEVRGETLRVQSVSDPDGRRRWQVLDCY